MGKLVISGGHIVTPIEERFTDLLIENASVIGVGDFHSSNSTTTIDASNCYVTPGLIDLQLNGGPQCNLWGDPTDKEFQSLCAQQLRYGVTTFLPTLITDEKEHLKKNIRFLEGIGVGRGDGLVKPFGMRLPGIHLEGPCLSPDKPGVHPKDKLHELTDKFLAEIVNDSVKLITLAPELDPSGASLRLLRQRGVTISLGHSNATFEEASKAFDEGVKLMTHTFNALPAIHHRSPGAVTAALLDERVVCCVIPDGLHVDPHVVTLLIKTKGVERVVLVTDAAYIGTTGGGLVGSSISMQDAVKNVVRWRSATFQEAIRMASLNPARALGLDRLGHLGEGSHADVIIWDKDSLDLKHVIVGGSVVV